ncbi:MAG: hypothetical protein LUD15_09450 [Bacteroides sp.]|nr:hypothetical protein [Bacteroides sp.]
MSDKDIKGLFIEKFNGAEGDNNVVNIAARQSNTIHPMEKVAELYEELRQQDQQIYEMKLSRLRQENEELKKKK